MFVYAIDRVGSFTRPIFSIMRTYGSPKVLPLSSTLFFVNEDGWAVTTKGTAKMIIDASSIEQKYAEFKKKKKQQLEQVQSKETDFEQEIKQLEEEYKYTEISITQLKVRFIDCVDGLSGFQCRLHPNADLAIIRLDGFNKLKYSGYATFAADGQETRQGKYLCRLGFPFPEFKNFMYDVEQDDITWTNEGLKTSPRFPTEGMVTRLIGADNRIVGIEMSTPGYTGQNGGPLFDEKGIVHGMQSDVGSLNLGHCVHGDIIKQFLQDEGVKHYTDQKTPGINLDKLDLSYIIANNSGKLQ